MSSFQSLPSRRPKGPNSDDLWKFAAAFLTRASLILRETRRVLSAEGHCIGGPRGCRWRSCSKGRSRDDHAPSNDDPQRSDQDCGAVGTRSSASQWRAWQAVITLEGCSSCRQLVLGASSPDKDSSRAALSNKDGWGRGLRSGSLPPKRFEGNHRMMNERTPILTKTGWLRSRYAARPPPRGEACGPPLRPERHRRRRWGAGPGRRPAGRRGRREWL